MANNVKYRSGNYTVATAIGALRNESPLLPDLNEVLIFHQDFMQLGNYFEALNYNTLNPDLVNPAYLINESPREDAGGLNVRWTRSWARVPSSYSMAGGIYNYTFPGFSPGRDPIVLPVPVRVQRDFYLCGNGGVFASWESIPIFQAFRPYKDSPSNYTSTLSNSPAATAPTLAVYLGWIDDETEIIVEDSKVRPWAGSIYVRDTFYTKAR